MVRIERKQMFPLAVRRGAELQVPPVDYSGECVWPRRNSGIMIERNTVLGCKTFRVLVWAQAVASALVRESCLPRPLSTA